MKAAKYSKSQTSVINLGTKVIYKYPTNTQLFDVAKMVVNGRHPQNKDTFINESACSFIKANIHFVQNLLQLVVSLIVLQKK